MIYGACYEILEFLSPLEALFFQGTSRWMYSKGMPRCQAKWYFASNLLFQVPGTDRIMRYNTVTQRIDDIFHDEFALK